MTDGESDVVAGRDPPPAVRAREITLRYGKTLALNDVTLALPANVMVGVIGPDGVGKSSLLALISGSRRLQRGEIEVLGGDLRDAAFRRRISPRIAYMPQGLGKNLYPTLSAFENIDFFGRLFGQDRRERKERIGDLLASTGLAPFAERPAGKLSGGMKQKLGLCCALIHDPDLLILDEPTTGVDPLSRRQFWELIDRIRAEHAGMSVVVATAYMEEASRFDWLVAMDGGKVLATGPPSELLLRTETDSLEAAFVAMLPEEKRAGRAPVAIGQRSDETKEIAIEALKLTKRFGDFVAVDDVTFRIERGEIFGFLGSNGCGKTTTMKMLTGLLPVSGGEARLFGHPVDANDLETRRQVGYMSQAFSLYSELTVRQNLVLHARLFRVPRTEISSRVERAIERFGLQDASDSLPTSMPLGQRQRLSLAVALIHEPTLLILDEPTSGVDPIARDAFWDLLIELSRRDDVTIFISTHFMNEAARCDRISLMHAGRVLDSDTPTALIEKRGVATLEDAFVAYLEEATSREETAGERSPGRASVAAKAIATRPPATDRPSAFSFRRMTSYARREALELSRDPTRLTMAGLGSLILMLVMGYGISMDIENLTFAVLDRDQTTSSRAYALNLAGSHYFVERPPISDYEELDRRMRSGEIAVAIEIPHGFARDLARGDEVEIGVWIDGSMPQRGETSLGYVQGMHATWLADEARQMLGKRSSAAAASIEVRYRYNPDVRSVVAMAPAVLALLLMLIPAMLTSLSVVREKELGSIVNFYATPTTRLEFLIGKQLPYVLLGMINYLLLTAMAVTLFQVPLTGSFAAMTAGAALYVICATALGLLISSFMRSQIAAVFGTALLTILPATLYSGMIDPVSSLEGVGAFVGSIFPTTYFLTIARGVFSKSLEFADVWQDFLPLIVAAPTLIALSAALLSKQET